MFHVAMYNTVHVIKPVSLDPNPNLLDAAFSVPSVQSLLTVALRALPHIT